MYLFQYIIVDWANDRNAHAQTLSDLCRGTLRVSAISSFYIYERTFLKWAYATDSNGLSLVIPMSHFAVATSIQLSTDPWSQSPLVVFTQQCRGLGSDESLCLSDDLWKAASGHIYNSLKAISHSVIGHTKTSTCYDTACINCLFERAICVYRAF